MRKLIYFLFLLCVSCTNPLGDEDPLDTSSEAPPEAFDFLTVQNIDQKLLVSWTNASGAKSYELHYGTATATYTSMKVASKSPAVIEGLTAGQTYYMRLIAINELGETQSTSEKTFTHMGPPTAFTLTTAVATSGQVLLSWNASNLASSYSVKYGTSAGNYSTTAGTTTSTNYAITGLTNTVTYYFQVTAVNGAGSVNSTNSLSATPDVPPTVPLNPTSKVEIGKCTIEWDPPASGAPPITYTVRRIISPTVNVVVCNRISPRTCSEESESLALSVVLAP